jgi:hypothetical protein
MGLIAAPAISCRAFDTAEVVTEAIARELWSYGYRGCGQYVTLPGLTAGPGDITREKLYMLTGIGYFVWLYQHPRLKGWKPLDCNGQVDGTVATAHARDADYAVGAHIFNDLEGCHPSTTASDAKYFLETVSATTNRLGQRSGLYCGYGEPLDAQGLYFLHGFDSYISDAGHRLVQTRGCAGHQGTQIKAAGIDIDPVTWGPDLLGDMPMVCWDSRFAPSTAVAA